MRTDFQQDLKKGVFALKDNVSGFAHVITGGLVGQNHRSRTNSTLGVGGEDTVNPLVSVKECNVGGGRFVAVGQHDDIESGQIELQATNAGASSVDYSLPTPIHSTASNKVQSVQSRSGDQQTTREEVVEFYRQHNPDKLSSVDSILARYEGKETALLAKLQRQYKVSDSK
jgi:hypothetical protein